MRRGDAIACTCSAELAVTVTCTRNCHIGNDHQTARQWIAMNHPPGLQSSKHSKPRHARSCGGHHLDRVGANQQRGLGDFIRCSIRRDHSSADRNSPVASGSAACVEVLHMSDLVQMDNLPRSQIQCSSCVTPRRSAGFAERYRVELPSTPFDLGSCGLLTLDQSPPTRCTVQQGSFPNRVETSFHEWQPQLL